MRFPGGDSMRDMQARIVSELEAIAADHPREIVAVISHADLIKAALAHYLGCAFRFVSTHRRKSGFGECHHADTLWTTACCASMTMVR